ncbi:hypothetical protein [Micromonospora sp. NPDC005203]|uniref:hypothetical protein n=1 Tax=Micromonospora sp. NPDC005203 TaxID=3364226 RepID=UPI0036CA7EB6
MDEEGWEGLTEETDEHLRAVTEMLGLWARTTRQDAAAYRQTAQKMREVDLAHEKGGYGIDDRGWRRAYEALWVAGYRLVTSGFHMEKWHKVHRDLRGKELAMSQALRTVRNTLVHLDEAEFDWGFARKKGGDTRQRAIDALPGERLLLGWAPSYGEHVFGLISVEKLDERAGRLTWVDEMREDLLWEPTEFDYARMEEGYEDDVVED